MVYALQMGGWQEKCPLVWVGWGLRWKGSEWYELQAALKLCCMNMCFLKYPNLLRGLPSISTGAVSWSLRGLKSCSAPPAQSECIHAGSPVIAIHCPMHKPQGSCFWVSVLRSCSKVPIRTMERTDLPMFSDSPPSICGLKSIRVLSFNPAFCYSMDWCSPRIWGSINHTYLSLFLFKCKQHMKKTGVSFCVTQMKLCRRSSIRPTLFTFSFPL